jgi:hypothetical protein
MSSQARGAAERERNRTAEVRRVLCVGGGVMAAHARTARHPRLGV